MNNSENITLSVSEGKYIKVIFDILEVSPSGFATTGEIAEKINAKRGSVTEMLQKLGNKSLVFYTKYKGVQLTILGIGLAKTLKSEQKEWNSFLTKQLLFSSVEANELSERLIHLKNKELVKRLIDNNKNVLDLLSKKTPQENPPPRILTLNKSGINSSGKIIGIATTDLRFIQYLQRNGINIGDRYSLLSIDEYDLIMQVKINESYLALSEKVAKNIFIKKSDTE